MKTKLLNDLKEAMLQKDTIRKNTIQIVRAEILKKEKDTQTELSNDDIIRIIKKERDGRFDLLKQIDETDRKDLINQTFTEMTILNTYLPKQLTTEELETEVNRIVNELNATSVKDMGKVMKKCKEELEMVSNPTVLADIVKSKLQNIN